MSRLKGRVRTLEKKVSATRKGPVTTKLVYVGDCKDDAEREERVKQVESAYFDEHGTLDGLVILETVVRAPGPLPRWWR